MINFANASLGFDNNVNTIVQKDSFGNYQNIAYYDADGDLVIGPNDVKTQILTSVPINLFRHHVFSDFDETVLDNKWIFTPYNGGINSQVPDSCTKITTGNQNGGGGKISLNNVNIPIIAGQRIYFYMMTQPNGNLELTFGLELDANNFIRFRRTDGDAAGNVFSETCTGGVLTSNNTGQPGDSVRRLYCIEIAATNTVNFYISTDAGVLQLKQTHTTNIPVGNHKAFVKFVNNDVYTRDLLIDVIALVNIR